MTAEKIPFSPSYNESLAQRNFGLFSFNTQGMISVNLLASMPPLSSNTSLQFVQGGTNKILILTCNY
jgi:hypothetical protein